MEVNRRWHFLLESQWRKATGIAVTVIVILSAALGLYDLAVAQLAPKPDNWLRARAVLDWLPWYLWVIGALVIISALLFEGGYRASRRRDTIIDDAQTLIRNAAPVIVNPVFRIQDGWLLFEVTNGGGMAEFTVRYTILSEASNPAYDGVWRDSGSNVTTMGKGARKVIRLANWDIEPGYGLPEKYVIKLTQLLDSESRAFIRARHSKGQEPQKLTLRVTITANPPLVTEDMYPCTFAVNGGNGLEILGD